MRIVLGVSGGIAAYKACEIVRGLDRAGAAVQVILTRNATRFVAPLALRTLSRHPVLLDTFAEDEDRTVQHIELARDASALVVAPATANVLAKLARGIADDLLSTFYLSVAAPVLVAPAMNTRMLVHPATRESLTALASRGVAIVPPGTGWLAEGEMGWGRMAEPAEIVARTLAAARRSTELAGRSILITAGPTREALDPVRFLSNRSSGRMGYALANACARRAARVTLISGPVNEPPPFGVELVRVETAAELREAVLRLQQGRAAVFMTAAVGDYVPRRAPAKIKRSGAPLTLTLDEGPDVLAELGRLRATGAAETLLVGFAAETEALVENARAKLERKNLDFIVANDVSQQGVGFDAPDNEVTILARGGGIWHVSRASKTVIAEAILDRVFGAAGGE